MSNFIKEEKELIINWIKEQFITTEKEKAIILIDKNNEINSYVALELLVSAIDPKNIIAVYTSPVQIDLLKRFGTTQFLFQSIDSLTEAFIKRLPQTATLSTETPESYKNITERIKMTALYGLSNILGNALVVGYINKTQDLNGDFVKYGNASDLEILKSFYESDVINYYSELTNTKIGVSQKTYELETVYKTVLDGIELPKNFNKEKFNDVLKQMRETEHKRITASFYGEMD